ncbi:unnamed protein product [Bathycoccus prasinos]
MARGGKKTHQLEDQYGGFEASEDASNASGFGGGGGGGFKGGGEGGGGVKGTNLKYERVVPKFLEKHADLLVGNAIVRPREEEELRGIGDEEEDLLGERRRGFGTTPMTSKEENNTKESIEEQCLTLKGSGNRCFQNGEYERAADMFTKCIALREKAGAVISAAEDNSHIYYSNRSAAYVKLGQFELAKRDALESIERSRGEWAKGWVRLAVASLALDDLTTHAKAYARAFKLDPLNDDLKDKMNKAQKQEQKAIENGLFKFKSNASSSSVKASSVGAKKETKEIGGAKKRKNRIDGNAKEKKKSKKKNDGGVLSFNEEEEEEEQ